MDKIVLTGLHFYGYHGCLPEEKRHGQPFHIDLVLETDLERAGQTDDLTQTVDYSAVYGVVKAVVEGPSYDLIERVGQVIADRILAQFPLVQALTVTVHKPQAPIGGLPSSWKGGAMAKFYLSIGANLGDRMATLRQAVRLLADTPGVTVTAVSPFYETPPWGKTDQPAFINGAVAVETEGSGQELLDACLAIERRLGRVRHEKWGARTIDIDLVYSPDEACQTETLTLPHPYVTQRAFVLVPLRDLAPDLILCGRPIGDWLDRLPDTDSIRKKDSNYGKNTHCR